MDNAAVEQKALSFINATNRGIPISSAGLEAALTEYESYFKDVSKRTNKMMVHYSGWGIDSQLTSAFRRYLTNHPELITENIYLKYVDYDNSFCAALSPELLKKVYLVAPIGAIVTQNLTFEMLDEVLNKNRQLLKEDALTRNRVTDVLANYYNECGAKFLRSFDFFNESNFGILNYNNWVIVNRIKKIICEKSDGMDYLLENYKKMGLSFTSLSLFDLPIEFIKKRPSRVSWTQISRNHSMTKEFGECFEDRIKFEDVGSFNSNAVVRAQRTSDVLSDAALQNITMDFIEQYYRRIPLSASFASILINALHGKCDFEDEVNKRLGDFFSLYKYNLAAYLRLDVFSYEFLQKNYKNFTCHQLKQEMEAALERRRNIDAKRSA